MLWLRRGQIILAAVTLLGFALSGLYLRSTFPAAYHGDEGIHMMFRANHIYLLLVGLSQLQGAIYFTARTSRAGRTLQALGILGHVIATLLLGYAFFHDTAAGDFHRLYTRFGILTMVIGSLFHLLAARRQ